jgi:hypothetical protein
VRFFLEVSEVLQLEIDDESLPGLGEDGVEKRGLFQRGDRGKVVEVELFGQIVAAPTKIMKFCGS